MSPDIKGHGVLVVENDVATADFLDTIIRHYRPDIADTIFLTKSVEEAQEHLRLNLQNPSLIITTIQLSGDYSMAGKRLLEYLRTPDSPFNQVPILIRSGHDFLDLDIGLPERTRYMRTPATTDQYLEAIDDALSFWKEETNG